MSKRELSAVSRLQGNNQALKSGEVILPDFDLAFEEVNPLPRAFRRMVRESAYDVSEMALTTYITARAHGARITAIPVFLVRDFHHKSMVASEKGGVTGPGDLAGRRVGVKRGFTVTTGVWARAILAEEYGLDPRQVTWARSDDEHVADWRPPSHVEDLGGTGTLEDQLALGTVEAAVGLPSADGTRPLIDDAFEAGLAALRQRGFYPINHLVVVRDDLLSEAPDLAGQLFEAFAESKRRYVQDLRAGRIDDLTAVDRVHLAAMEVMDDPLPYGLEPNRAVLENLMAHVSEQGIIDAPITLDTLFAPSTLDRTGQQ